MRLLHRRPDRGPGKVILLGALSATVEERVTGVQVQENWFYPWLSKRVDYYALASVLSLQTSGGNQ